MGVEHTLKQNIWVACSDNDLERIKELLTGSDLEPKVDVNCKDEYGYTPLHAAASYGHEEVVKYLIQMGANVNIRDEDGDTPLHVTESLSTLMILLNHGADPLVRNYVGKTPYHVYLEEELDDVSAYL
ncbi:ankyrin repeat-containing domain protein, partial [Paraphysoderma sedebokerense]